MLCNEVCFKPQPNTETVSESQTLVKRLLHNWTLQEKIMSLLKPLFIKVPTNSLNLSTDHKEIKVQVL